MNFRCATIAAISLIFNACTKEANNNSGNPETPVEQPVEQDDEPENLPTAEKVWDQIKAKDFSKAGDAKAGWAAINTILNMPEQKRIPIVRKLVLLKEGTTGVIHKMAQGSVNEENAKAINSMMNDLADAAAKKAWLEQADNGQDALSMLLVRNNSTPGDDAKALRTLTDEVAQTGVGTTLAIEKVWEPIRLANFAVMDDKRAQAMVVLAHVTGMAPGDARSQISQAITKKADIAATSSGLLQSIVQGPISPRIVKICEVLIEDQGDAAAKKDFLNQKLGSLTERAMIYLMNLNISKAAPGDGPGVRLSSGGLKEEAPYLDQLSALFLRNGAQINDVLPKNESEEEVTKFDLALELLFKHGNIHDFTNSFISTDFSADQMAIFIAWIIEIPERSSVLKLILTGDKLDEEGKAYWRAQVYSMAIGADMNTTVRNNNPVKIGGILGLGGSEFYDAPVELKNFNRILDNDFGLEPNTPAGNDVFLVYRGSLIWLLSAAVAFPKTHSIAKRKAVIRSIAKKLRSFHNQATWRTLLLKEAKNSGETAIDALVKDLRITRNEAKELLLFDK